MTSKFGHTVQENLCLWEDRRSRTPQSVTRNNLVPHVHGVNVGIAKNRSAKLTGSSDIDVLIFRRTIAVRRVYS